MEHQGIFTQLVIPYPPKDMRALSAGVFREVCKFQKSNLRDVVCEFKDLDIFFEVLSKRMLSAEKIIGEHNFEIRLHVINTNNEMGWFSLSFNGQGELTKAQPKASMCERIENELARVCDEYISGDEGNRLKKRHTFKSSNVENQKKQLSQYLQQQNQEFGIGLLTKSRKLKRVITKPRSSGFGRSGSRENSEWQSKKGRKGEKEVCNQLISDLRTQFPSARELEWDNEQYRFVIGAETVAVIVWDDCNWKGERKRKNTVGYDIKVVRNNEEVFHEVKTGKHDLSAAQQEKAKTVGEGLYYWWRVYDVESKNPRVELQINWWKSLYENDSSVNESQKTNEPNTPHKCIDKPVHPKMPPSRHITENL